MPHKFVIRLLFFFTLILLAGEYGQAQTIPDFSNVKVDELSDQQIRTLLQQATSLGYTQQEFLQLARQQGLGLDEISKLVQRIDEVESARASTALDKPPRRGIRLNRDSSNVVESRMAFESEIFGLAFFKNMSRSGGFQPNLNIPTPRDYKLGAGDEVLIDLYGDSEQYYQALINPDGNILLENIGPIFLSGLTIEDAEKRVRSRMSRQYDGLTGSSPRTFLSLTLGDIRSINVSVVGEVEIPGNYTLSSFSSVFNALYATGGITENGTFREIKLFRNNELLHTLDAYDFLVNGNSKSNVRLEDNDVVVVSPYTNRVRVSGAVKRPGLYELSSGESLSDLIRFAGGFTESAFREQINVVRNVGSEKRVADVFDSQFDLFEPRPGDVYEIKEVLNRYTNRVQVKGAVFRPGNYAITPGLTAKQLIDKANGLRGDASRQRSLIIRSKEDLTTETISFDLSDLMDGTIADIPLQREDVLQIFSIYDLKEEQYVEISGEVNNGGVFGHSENMTVEDLIALAGGLKSSASVAKVEITRRLGDSSLGNVSEVFTHTVNKDLSVSQSGTGFTLQPFDHVVVRKNPDFFTQRFVSIEGQVEFPGQYAIKNQTERISSLVERSGGINQYAYVEGATLLRKTEFYNEQTDLERRIDDLSNLLDRYENGDPNLSEAELFRLKRISLELGVLNDGSQENQNLSSFAKRERLREIVQRNTLTGDVKLSESEAIGIDLGAILQNPGSKKDLILEEGDVLVIPRQLETVRLRGRVLYPTTVIYEQNRSLKYFINQAGGFANRAKRRDAYVIYANGRVASTKRFLFFRSYPKIEPGAEIIVPAKAPKLPITASEIIGITSGVATLALLISQIDFNGTN